MRSYEHLDHISVATYVVPTEGPESDGTAEWDSTSIVIAQLCAGGYRGLGYTYADAAAGAFVESVLAPAITGIDPLDTNAAWKRMTIALRNNGRPGIASAALSAMDSALWDLKGRILGAPVVELLGAAQDGIPVYGSGGFTSYTIAQLQSQLAGWIEQGIDRVKMKVGRCARDDLDRVGAARQAIGAGAELFVDANGGYSRKQALAQADAFATHRVTWFEEPVSSDDLEGLALMVKRAPPGMSIAAGEYGYDLFYFRRMLEAAAVDILQADASRCGGVTGFMRAAALAEAHAMPISAHTAPSLHAHVCCAVPNVIHVEYFHDHARIERLFFDGAAIPEHGTIRPDRTRPGLGLELKTADADRYRRS